MNVSIDIVEQMMRMNFGEGHTLSPEQREEEGKQLHNLLFAAFKRTVPPTFETRAAGARQAIGRIVQVSSDIRAKHRQGRLASELSGLSGLESADIIETISGVASSI